MELPHWYNWTRWTEWFIAKIIQKQKLIYTPKILGIYILYILEDKSFSLSTSYPFY